eukprot:9673206-Alexandrium_andersonii.AAC.1
MGLLQEIRPPSLNLLQEDLLDAGIAGSLRVNMPPAIPRCHERHGSVGVPPPDAGHDASESASAEAGGE